MKATERRLLIEQRIAVNGEVDFATLAREFEVSEMTIRRDVELLESRGAVRRIAGGAIAFIGRSYEPPFHARALDAAAEKAHIADAVVELLSPGESVILDSGSTALAVARAIRGKGLALTVLTPSLLAALELVDEPETTVLLSGGKVRQGELSLVGAEAETAFHLYNCDTYIMGLGGLDAEHGATDYHREEAFVKRAAIKAAGRVIAAVDSGKLGRIQLMNVADLADITVIVSDGGDSPTLTAARGLGVDVVHVKAPKQSEVLG